MTDTSDSNKIHYLSASALPNTKAYQGITPNTDLTNVTALNSGALDIEDDEPLELTEEDLARQVVFIDRANKFIKPVQQFQAAYAAGPVVVQPQYFYELQREIVESFKVFAALGPDFVPAQHEIEYYDFILESVHFSFAVIFDDHAYYHIFKDQNKNKVHPQMVLDFLVDLGVEVDVFDRIHKVTGLDVSGCYPDDEVGHEIE